VKTQKLFLSVRRFVFIVERNVYMVFRILRNVSEFIARWPGLPILVAIGLILISFVLRFLPDWPVVAWLVRTDLFLHVGLLLGLIGMLLGEAL